MEPERRVICAAIRAADGEVLIGVRHYSDDMVRQIECRTDGKKFHRGEQGFIDQHGRFLTREEAYQVAKAAGQILHPERCYGSRLYSEGLY